MAASPSLTSKTAWNFASGVMLIAGRFGAGLVVARLLGPDSLGRIAYWLWLADFAAMAAQLALPASLTRFIADRVGAGESGQVTALRRWIWRRFAGLVALGATLAALAAWTTGAFESPLQIALLAGYFLAQGIWTLAQADLAGQGRFATSAKINAGASLVLLLAVAAGAWQAGVAGAMIGYVVSTAVAAVAGAWQVRGAAAAPPGEPDADLRRDVNRFAFQTWIAVLLSAAVWGRMEIFFLERAWNAHTVAMFTVGLSLVTMVSQGPVLLADALMPHFAGLSGADRHEEIRQTYARATRLIAVLILPFALGGAAIIPVLLPLIYGADFAPASGIAVLLVAGASVQIGVVGGTVIYGLGRARFIAAIGAIGTLLALLAGVTVIPAWGAWGAAVARTAIQCAMTGAGFWFVHSRLKCPVPWASLARTVLAAATCAVVARLVVAAWPRPLALVPAVVAGAAVYLILMRALRVLTAGDATPLAQLGRSFPVAIGHRWTAFVTWMAA